MSIGTVGLAIPCCSPWAEVGYGRVGYASDASTWVYIEASGSAAAAAGERALADRGIAPETVVVPAMVDHGMVVEPAGDDRNIAVCCGRHRQYGLAQDSRVSSAGLPLVSG